MINQAGELTTRRGSVTGAFGDFHSMYPCSDGFYVGHGDSLLRSIVNNLTGELTAEYIRTDLSGNRIDYARRGHETFYCNGTEHGRLTHSVHTDWTENDWTGGETTDNFEPTPPGEHVTFLAGRFVISIGDEILYTEYGLPGIVDTVRNRQRFGSRVIMVCAVQTGLFVSDTEAVYFLSGENPHGWMARRVLNYPAIEWAVNPDLVPGSDMGLETNALCALFATVKGPVVGLPDGTPVNLIEKDVAMPDCNCFGSLMVVDNTQILIS